MSRVDALKSGMSMWPGAYSLMSPLDTSLADIICGGGSGGGGEEGRDRGREGVGGELLCAV